MILTTLKTTTTTLIIKTGLDLMNVHKVNFLINNLFVKEQRMDSIEN